MKKELYIARPAKFYSTALLTSMLFFCGIIDVAASTGTEAENKAQIVYVGSTNSLMTFNVNFNNIEDEKFVLELSDDHGEVLYRNTFTGKDFNKNIYLKNLGDKCKVKFTIKAGKQTINQQFEIDSQTRLIQETVVTKI
jgi:hypothetical protein